MDLNLNSADCIKEISHIGETVYTNICSGSSTTIAWGIDGWLGLFMTIAFVLVIGLLIGMLIRIIND